MSGLFYSSYPAESRVRHRVCATETHANSEEPVVEVIPTEGLARPVDPVGHSEVVVVESEGTSVAGGGAEKTSQRALNRESSPARRTLPGCRFQRRIRVC